MNKIAKPCVKVFKIKKKSGKMRTIFAPNRATKARQRLLVPELTRLAEQECEMSIVHGFMPMRSPVTNATKHIGYQYTLSFDLENFFDTVTLDMVKDKISKAAQNWCFVDKIARQGFPTSPVISNLAAAKMDRAIVCWLKDHTEPVMYTRYADDLTFSFNDRATLDWLKQVIPTQVRACGFAINPAKTRCQWAGAGRRVITGIAVDDKAIYPTREVRRRLRAALHQGNAAQAGGLAEWCKLRPPNPAGPRKSSRVTACMLRRMNRLSAGKPDYWKD